MFHIENQTIKDNLLKGKIGLEKESLRISKDGYIAQTAHPFYEHEHIVRDFSEAQTEINTPVANTIEEALEYIEKYNRILHQTCAANDEYIWPFSNPPYIRNEKDIPVAQFHGKDASKTLYREYLSKRYGRYKMCFSGIHFNYSFDEGLLKKNFDLDGVLNYKEAKNQFYLDLAQKLAIYGWILVALTAASPILDTSYVLKGHEGQSQFLGMSSVRCSELGYWNFFTPTFDYSNLSSYVASIQKYVNEGLLDASSELYYPIRLKPYGQYNLENLKKGVSHIELRMMDLNPLTKNGMDIRDLKFIQLFLVWLASLPNENMSPQDQVQAAQNFKNAAHYDLMTVTAVMPNGPTKTMVEHGKNIINSMQIFYRDFDQDIQSILQFEKDKFIDENNRYAYQLMEPYKEHFVSKGLELCESLQQSWIE